MFVNRNLVGQYMRKRLINISDHINIERVL